MLQVHAPDGVRPVRVVPDLGHDEQLRPPPSCNSVAQPLADRGFVVVHRRTVKVPVSSVQGAPVRGGTASMLNTRPR